MSVKLNIPQTVAQYIRNHSRDLNQLAMKDPNGKLETGLRLWQKDNKKLIQSTANSAANTNQEKLGDYSRASAALWAALDEKKKERYIDLAKELNDGTATDEEKRKYVPHIPSPPSY